MGRETPIGLADQPAAEPLFIAPLLVPYNQQDYLLLRVEGEGHSTFAVRRTEPRFLQVHGAGVFRRDVINLAGTCLAYCILGAEHHAAAAYAARLEPPAGAGGRLNPVALQPHRWRLYYVLGYPLSSPRDVCLEHPCFTRYDAPRRMGRGRSSPRTPDKPSLRELRRCMPALRLCYQTTAPYASGRQPRTALRAAAARCLLFRFGRTSCGTLRCRRRPSIRW